MWARWATEEAMDDPHAPASAPRLLTIEQVAASCQVSSKTVYRAIRRGALRASRLGMTGAYRIQLEEMEMWIDKWTAGPPQAPAPREPLPAARQRRDAGTGEGQL